MDLNETDISNLCETNLDIEMNELDAHEESFIEFSDTKNSSNTEFEKEVLWICPICNIDLKRKKKLRDHIKSSHQGQKVFRCSLCEASFELKDSLKRHLKKKHVNQVTDEWTEIFQNRNAQVKPPNVEPKDGEKRKCNTESNQ